MILDFFGRERVTSQKLENYGSFGGGLHRVDNAVRLISDNGKYIKLRYI